MLAVVVYLNKFLKIVGNTFIIQRKKMAKNKKRKKEKKKEVR